jgi:lipopolysaccharide export system permease protein
MRLLDRYLLRELLTPLVLCLGGFLIFWVSLDLFQQLNEMQENKLHLLDVLEYAAAMVPAFLVTILPIILLLALLYTLTAHARHNEITAMRAAGISLWRICVPYYLTGLVAAVGVYALNEYVVPDCSLWADQIMHRYVKADQNADVQKDLRGRDFRNTSGTRHWVLGEFHPDNGEISQPLVVWRRPDGSTMKIQAELARFTNNVWTFYNVHEYVQATGAPTNQQLAQTNVLAMPEFDERPSQMINELKIDEYRRMDTSDLDIPLPDILGYLHHHPHLTRKDTGWLQTQLQRRFSTPATCLVVVMIAVPFGAVSGRRNLFTGVASSIFICFFFIIIQKVSLAYGTNGNVPAWLAAWLPNFIFAGTGLFLTLRAK